MTDFIKILLYAILIIIGICLIVPLLCMVISWSGPYFNKFFSLLATNPIILFIFVGVVIIIFMKFIIDNF